MAISSTPEVVALAATTVEAVVAQAAAEPVKAVAVVKEVETSPIATAAPTTAEASTPSAAPKAEDVPKIEESAEASSSDPEQDTSEATPVEPSIPGWKEESNLVSDLKESEKKALEEFKVRIQQAIKEGEFKVPKKVVKASKEQDSVKAAPKTVAASTEEQVEEVAPVPAPETTSETPTPVAETSATPVTDLPVVAEEKAKVPSPSETVVEVKATESKVTPAEPKAEQKAPAVTEKVEPKAASVVVEKVDTKLKGALPVASGKVETKTAAVVAEKVEPKAASVVVEKVDTKLKGALPVASGKVETKTAAVVAEKVEPKAASVVVEKVDTKLKGALPVASGKVETKTAAVVAEKVEPKAASVVVEKVDTKLKGALPVASGKVETKTAAVVAEKVEPKAASVVVEKVDTKLKGALPVASGKVETKTAAVVAEKVEAKSAPAVAPVVVEKVDAKAASPVVSGKVEVKAAPVVAEKVEAKAALGVAEKVEAKVAPVVVGKVDANAAAPVVAKKVELEAAPVIQEKVEVKAGTTTEEKVEKKADSAEDPAATDVAVAVTNDVKADAAETEAEEEEEDSTPPEDISLWGVPLLSTKGDKRTEVILLKFLRAREFSVKEAFKQLRNTIIWRKTFNADNLLNEEFGTDLDGVAYIHGVTRDGQPVCYNVPGVLQDKELYQKTFGDAEKLNTFLRGRVQVLEKGIQLLNFAPEGPSAMVQITDLKNAPGFGKKEFKAAANQAITLLQDNYPELCSKRVFINVPIYFSAMYAVVSPLLTKRTKSKFVVAPAGKSTECLLKLISADNIPVQYGGLSRLNDTEFTPGSALVHELVLKGGKSTTPIDIDITEVGSTVVWDFSVIGYDVTYGAEFVPSAEGSYTTIIEKSKKLPSTTEEPVRNSFKATEPGKVVLSVRNLSRKKKTILYRYTVKGVSAAAVKTS